MNPWQPPQQPPPTTPRRENQILGPRPAPLRVSKDSVKIKKPPKHPAAQPPPLAAALHPLANKPVIIYSVSPKPIYVEASDFRSLVQHLTGRETAAPPTPGSPIGETPVSPAARLAALERTSPKERDWRQFAGVGGGEDDNSIDMLVPGEVDIGQMPGILSPAPSNLPVISSEIFSPMAAGGTGEGQGMWGFSELMMSPFMSNTSFLPSPSALFLSNTPTVSRSPTAEFFNIFDSS